LKNIKYMTRKNVNSTPGRERTYLDKGKSKFKEELQKRIVLGENIAKTKIEKEDDFEKLKSEYSSWDDYNLNY